MLVAHLQHSVDTIFYVRDNRLLLHNNLIITYYIEMSTTISIWKNTDTAVFFQSDPLPSNSFHSFDYARGNESIF